ncbi:MAG: UDP-N-acetylmuramate dehydrogenase [Ruminococcaceae bacterium]|nr:UDP-N-acetylmuramate dehydrogenase [Oscillospiraceae bacterium]
MMELTRFQQKIGGLLPHINLLFSEPLSKHTSFRIGGSAEVMAFPKNATQLSELLVTCKDLQTVPVILGAGTNVLAPDAGIPGLVICLKDCLDGMQRLDETHIRVFGGVTMTRAAVFAANLGLGGMEFAHGIPGTVGGGVYMNAGAYGGEICQICESVDVMDRTGKLTTYSVQEMEFSYRHSILEDNGGIVVSAVFALIPRPTEEIKATMKELMARRSASQPLDLPSAGSAFKRPVGGYAGALIEQAGLKGFQVGGAAISTKHAGFAVNLGGATAEDVKNLLKQVSDIVFERSGIRLEPEVRIW